MIKKLINLALLFILYPMSTHDKQNEKKINTLIPREILFSNPDKAAVKLSFDGKYISYLAPKNGVLNIFIAPFNDPENTVNITDDTERGINGYIWSYDNQHILYYQDHKGDENMRIYSHNIHSKELKLLTPEKKVMATILGITPNNPDEVAIALNERNPKFFDIYKLNLKTGDKELIFENNEFTPYFILDDNLDLRFVTKLDEDGSKIYLEYKNGEFKDFITFSFDDVTNSSFISLDAKGENLYILDSRDRDTNALKKINLNTNKIEILAEGNKADLSVLTIDPINNYVQAVAENYERAAYKTLDPDIQGDLEYLQTIDPGDLYILTRTTDDKIWLVAYEDDNFPVKYYYYDRASRTASYIFNNRKALSGYQLSPMHPLVIKSRDGLDLVSYLTLPFTDVDPSIDNKLQPTSPLPMVLKIHGGPWSRDSWGLDIEHQWLANRGYAVLSINYRGSTGLGKKFANAGHLQWGKKMQDDLIDAVNWCIDNKIADPKKIAIYGGSYGGYATLCGLTLTPEVFACGVDNVGPSNLYTLLTSFPAYWSPMINKFKKCVGNWETEEDKKRLAEVSPLTHVHKITKPLLISQGDNDPRVTKIEADQIYDAMRAKGLEVTYLRYPKEGHGFVKADNRKSFNAIMEEFLAKYLGGKLEALTSADFEGADLLLNNKPVKDNTVPRIGG